jgi:hypothetical protein
MKICISTLFLIITIFSCKSPDVVTPTTPTNTTPPTTTVTPPIIKPVTTNTVDIKLNSVVLNGEVSDEGGSPVTDRGFYWSETNTIPTDKDNKVQVGSGKGTYSYTLEGLKINTKYYYKSYSTNSKGTSTSDVQTVKTKTFEFKVVSDYTFGSTGIDYINFVRKSLDGNNLYITGDPGHGPEQNQGLIKIDNRGYTIWKIDFDKTYYPKSFIETSNGVFLSGYKNINGKIVYFLGQIVNGKIMYENNDMTMCANYINLDLDGGFLLVGVTKASNGYSDIIINKTDEKGIQKWFKTYGGDNQDNISKIIELQDSYLICGNSYSGTSGNKTSTNKGESDFWIFKIDKTGNKIWDKDLGGSNTDILKSVFVDKDGSILIFGDSASGTSVDKSQSNRGSMDYWIVKLDSQGNKIWDKTFGGNDGETSKGILKTQNEDFILFGESYSLKSEDKTDNCYSNGFSDIWLVCIDKNGNKLWDKIVGGKYEENVENIIYNNSTSFYELIGNSSSPISFDKKTSELANGKNLFDYWIVNLLYELKD